MKRFLAFMMVLVLLVSSLPVRMVCAQEEDQTGNTENQTFMPLQVTRTKNEIASAVGVLQGSDHWYGDSKIITGDRSASGALLYTINFGNQTRFPADDQLPPGFDAETLMEWGKDPGLNVDILHHYGFTGKGAVLAYVDQPYTQHEQYKHANIHYTNLSESKNSIHGPAVLSLLAGKDIGTAPEAEIYYYVAASDDQAEDANALYKLIEQNEKLPEDQKIRMVGFSDNIIQSEKNPEALEAAVRACEEAGIMVWFCGDYSTASFVPYADKNDPVNVIAYGNRPELVYVPSSGRTTAATDEHKYIYWGEGGLSWTMPYVLGLYGIAVEIDPSLTKDDLKTLIVETSYVNQQGRRIVNPVGFVAETLRHVGRDAEAQMLLDAVTARTRYLYAVVNTSMMSEEDLQAIAGYLEGITDAQVIQVDASAYSNAQELYDALRKDANSRGGTTVGVQLFGTPQMVPSFRIKYKVQMISDVYDDGSLYTDLFYGNFRNHPAMLDEKYSVMDHLAQGWNVELVPEWPVVRLPLQSGEYQAFMQKYEAFAIQTGLEQLDKVVFYNPIFKTSNPIDDMGRFIKRMRDEMKFTGFNYRVYGNQKGDYPVTMKVLGDFSAENMALENKEGVWEYIISSHGQRDNIDACYFEGDTENRLSVLNMGNVGVFLGTNPYYLDVWTCLNGWNMADNLTTAALGGQCVGMFSATAVISNNGVNWRDSVSEMAQSNFYYFYYHYLKALHEGDSRSQAFYTAQREYALALMEDTTRPLRGEGNVQFNLYNLLAYHNFGVIEPNAAALVYCNNHLIMNMELTQKEIRVVRLNETLTTEPSGVAETFDGYFAYNCIPGSRASVEEVTVQQFGREGYRITISYSGFEYVHPALWTSNEGADHRKEYPEITLVGDGRIELDLTAEDVRSLQAVYVDILTVERQIELKISLYTKMIRNQTEQAKEPETVKVTGALAADASRAPVGEAEKVRYATRNELVDRDGAAIHSCTVQAMEGGVRRFTVDYTLPKGLNIYVFDPPNGKNVSVRGSKKTAGGSGTLVFDLSEEEHLSKIDQLTINFYKGDNDRFFVFLESLQTEQVKESKKEKESANETDAFAVEASLPPAGEVEKVSYSTRNELVDKAGAAIHSCTVQTMEGGVRRYTVEYTLPEGMNIYLFDPPNGENVSVRESNKTTGGPGTLVFDLSEEEHLSKIDQLTINFNKGHNDRFLVFLESL